jgi:hypothetical protein
VGGGGVFQGACGRQAHLPLHRLLVVPLVPCDGARVVRTPRHRRPAEPTLRQHQGGSRGAPRCRRDLHQRGATDGGARGLAAVGVPDARRLPVLRGHLLPATGVRRSAGARGGRVADQSRAGACRRCRAEGGAGATRGDAPPVATRRAQSQRLPRLQSADSGRLRPHSRRVRRRAEIPTQHRAARAADARRGVGRYRLCGHGAHDYDHDGDGRNLRPHRRGVPSLLDRRTLAAAPLREDALRQRATRLGVCARLRAHRRRVLRRHRRAHAGLDAARDAHP